MAQVSEFFSEFVEGAPVATTGEGKIPIVQLGVTRALSLSTIAAGSLSGDVTGPYIATVVSRIGGQTVVGTTGSGNVVFSDTPVFTGIPTAPTAAGGTNTTQIATTAFVAAMGSTGAAALAAETTARTNADTTLQTNINNEASARAAADVLLAPLASPVFTGDPRAPTPATNDNDTSIATTAFVKSVTPVAANPTATGGDVAVPGVATTYMRSDGAPAIQKASAAVFGIARVDGTTITATGGVISAVPSSGITQLTQDVLAGPGSGSQVATLATVNSNVGTFQGLTLDGKGRVTAATNQNYLTSALAATTYAPLASPVFTGDPRAPTPATGDSDTSIATTAFVKAQGYPRMTISDTAPVAPVAGDHWWDSVGAQLYIWFFDGTSTQWVPASTTPGPVGPVGPPGATGPQGPIGATGPSGGGGVSGTVAGQIAIAGSATSITSSIPTSTFLTPAQGDTAYVNVGGDTMTGLLDIRKAVHVDTTNNGQLYITDTSSMAQGVGGYLQFQGSFTGTTVAQFAAIGAQKQNGTDNDYSGNLGFWARANGSGGFAAASPQMMIQGSTGNVGIGTTGPTQKLNVVAGVDNYAAKFQGNVGSDGVYLGTLGGTPWIAGLNAAAAAWAPLAIGGSYTAVNAAGGEVMRITGGNVGIGTTAPNSKLTVSANAAALQAPTAGNVLQLAAADSITSRISVDSFAAATSVTFRRANGAATGLTPLASGDTISSIGSNGWGGSTYGLGANLAVITTQPWTESVRGCTMTFNVTANGAASPAEAMRIDHNGNVGIGTTGPVTRVHATKAGSAYPAVSGTVQSAGHLQRLDDNSGAVLDAGGNGGNGYWLQACNATNLATNYNILLNPNGGLVGISTTGPLVKLDVRGQAAAGAGVAAVRAGPNGADTTTTMVAFTDFAVTVGIGGIVRNGTNTVNYATTSDARLKEGVSESSRGLDALMRIKVSDYRMGETAQQGLLAQDVATVYPEAVHQGGDDPQIEPWMIDYGRLTPLLIRTAQQQQETIEILTRRLAALEARFGA